MGKRILIVDDYAVTRQIMRVALGKAGFTTQEAESGNRALEIVRRHGLPHLVLVDLHMPGMNGFVLCRKLLAFSDIPIIIVTADDSEEKVLEAIRSFAEDYIIKPFRPAELVARVERVLSRVPNFDYTQTAEITLAHDLVVNFSERTVCLQNKMMKLTPIESKILYILLQHAGRIVTIEFLLRRVWAADHTADEQRLHTHIYRLRKKMEVNPKKPKYLLSEWAMGYQLQI